MILTLSFVLYPRLNGKVNSAASESGDNDADDDDDDDEYMKHCKFMVLDGLTMHNLDILSADGNLEGSLLAKIDQEGVLSAESEQKLKDAIKNFRSSFSG